LFGNEGNLLSCFSTLNRGVTRVHDSDEAMGDCERQRGVSSPNTYINDAGTCAGGDVEPIV